MSIIPLLIEDTNRFSYKLRITFLQFGSEVYIEPISGAAKTTNLTANWQAVAASFIQALGSLIIPHFWQNQSAALNTHLVYCLVTGFISKLNNCPP